MSGTGQDFTRELLKQLFIGHYAPYRLKQELLPPRSDEELAALDAMEPRMRALVNAVDEQRAKKPETGMILAGDEILSHLLQMLRTEKGVHAETLLAILGAAGGAALSKAITKTAEVFGSEKVLPVIGCMVAETTTGEKYLMGDFPGNEFCSFCMTAAASPEPPYALLKPISAACAGSCGKPAYWDTPFYTSVRRTPLELAQKTDGIFDPVFAVYTRFPHERPMAFAIAAQKAIKQLGTVLPKETALAILAEYGWRTSHYIG